MGCHNFKDEALIKRWRASQKMNGIGRKPKDKNKWNICQKFLKFVVGSCVCFRSFKVHIGMNVESTIKKFKRIIKEKEAQKNEHRPRQEEEVEVWRKTKVGKKLRKTKCVVVLNI